MKAGDLVGINWEKFITIDGLDESSIGVIINVHESPWAGPDQVSVLWPSGNVDRLMVENVLLVKVV